MEVINFAQGEFVTIGMFVAYWLYFLTGIHPLLTLIFSVPLCFALGVIIQKFIINRLLMSGALIFMQTLSTLGLSLIIQNTLLVAWFPYFRTLPWAGSIALGSVYISIPRLIAAIGCSVMAFIIWVLLKKTKLGLAIRAASDNRIASQLMGVNIWRIYMFTFGLGVACAAFGGAFLSLYFYIHPTSGSTFTLLMFTIVALGGMGEISGASVGAIIIGLVESFSAALLGTQWKEVMDMVIFILILLIRPQGLFGKKVM
jgi:branched-chain amino acid transport system permease protein